MSKLKFYLESADAAGYTDGVTKGQLFDKLNCTDVLSQADVVLVRTVCGPPFRFNHHLNRLLTAGKPIVVVDYLEYGWNWDFSRGNVLGQNFACPCTQHDNTEWGTFEAWIREAQPILTFKRELRNRDVTDALIPIDFLATHPKPPVVSLADYSKRPYDVTYVWGYSHPIRAKMHGQIFEAMGTKNIEVIGSFEQLIGRPENAAHHVPTPIWLSIFQPYWVRKPMGEVFRVQEQGRIAVCLPGAGFKCFREQEAPHGTVMAMLENDLARSYEWIHGTNALIMREGHEFEDLYDFTQLFPRAELYDIYRRGQATLDCYRPDYYIPNYFIPNIEKRL